MSEVKPVKKIPGCITSRDQEYRVIRLKITAGNVDSDQMNIISDIADRYGRGYVSLTSRMGIEIPWVPKDKLDAAVEELKSAGLVVGSTGPSVRAIVSCKGTVCRYGLEDTQELCRQLDQAFYGMPMPAKFKIGITGCPNNCIKTQLNDLAFMGQSVPKYDEDQCTNCYACVSVCKVKAIEETENGIRIDRNECVNCGSCIKVCPTGALTAADKGYAVFLGGKFGRKYIIGRRMEGLYSIEETVDLTAKILDYYKSNAQAGERFGDMLERTGFDLAERALKK